MSIEIDPTTLSPDELRQARYLAATARYRALAARLAAGEAVSRDDLDALRDEIEATEPTEQLRPIREVAEAAGVAAGTIRAWARAGQIETEKHGNLWYVSRRDVEYCRDTDEPQRGWPLGKPRRVQR